MAIVYVPPDQTVITVLGSAARTTDTTSPQFVLGQPARGLLILIDITAGSSLSIVYNVRLFSPTSGKSIVLLASASQTTTTATPLALRIHPELTASANLIAKDFCPSAFEVFADVSNANSATYSVEAQLAL